MIDGDTIIADVDLGFRMVMKDQRFRLIGIDAPEKRGISRLEGERSMEVLRNLIEDRWITIKTCRDRKEKWGRWLAEVWLNDININEKMINEGHAKPM